MKRSELIWPGIEQFVHEEGLEDIRSGIFEAIRWSAAGCSARLMFSIIPYYSYAYRINLNRGSVLIRRFWKQRAETSCCSP
jgi:hypothetical protein